MYTRCEIKPIVELSCRECVEIVGSICSGRNYSLHTLFDALAIQKCYGRHHGYSAELAYVCTVVSSKYNEDASLSTLHAAVETDNHAVYELERRLLRYIDYRISRRQTLASERNRCRSAPPSGRR
jgi:hypothetical protein